MHYTGTIWRPPYEASSLLLEPQQGVHIINANSVLCMMTFPFGLECHR